MSNEKPMNNNSHNYAIQIEQILRHIFMCDRGGFGGEIDADIIDAQPSLSIMLGLAIIYHHSNDNDRNAIDAFIKELNKYEDMSISDIMKLENGIYQIENMLNRFRELI